MSAERLGYCIDLLEGDAPLPAPTREWLRDALQSILSGTDPANALGLEVRAARQERDAIIRRHADEIPGTTWAKCRTIAGEARRIHRGRRTALAWIQRADRLRPIPESPRQIFNLLK